VSKTLFFRGVLIVTSVTLVQLALRAQAQNAPTNEKAARVEVTAIVKRLLQESERDVGQGVKASWPPIPSTEDLIKLVDLGDQAIPVLEELLLSEDARACGLAVRFICARGSAKCAPPLVSFLRLSRTSPGCRTAAVLSLRDAPESIVGDILRDLASKDSDDSVRRAAQSLLTSRSAPAK
jgi:HEAT repeat protein